MPGGPSVNITSLRIEGLDIINNTDTITITLSEASNNFESTDITAVGGTLSNFTGSGTSYTVLLTAAQNSTTTIKIIIDPTTFSTLNDLNYICPITFITELWQAYMEQ